MRLIGCYQHVNYNASALHRLVPPPKRVPVCAIPVDEVLDIAGGTLRCIQVGCFVGVDHARQCALVIQTELRMELRMQLVEYRVFYANGMQVRGAQRLQQALAVHAKLCFGGDGVGDRRRLTCGLQRCLQVCRVLAFACRPVDTVGACSECCGSEQDDDNQQLVGCVQMHYRSIRTAFTAAYIAAVKT